MLAEPEGGNEKVQALGNVVVVKDDAPPDVGDPAIPSDTPTLASAGGDAAAITTRTPPDESLLQYSVADSLQAKVPFVVTFATPKFCASRTCGPVVDVVEEVQHGSTARRSASSTSRCTRTTTRRRASTVDAGVEPPTEPWTFLVGANGKIVDRFEGTVSVNELETAVREKLLALSSGRRRARPRCSARGPSARAREPRARVRRCRPGDLVVVREARPLRHARGDEARGDRRRADAALASSRLSDDVQAMSAAFVARRRRDRASGSSRDRGERDDRPRDARRQRKRLTRHDERRRRFTSTWSAILFVSWSANEPPMPIPAQLTRTSIPP
jgi:hypothetical protein